MYSFNSNDAQEVHCDTHRAPCASAWIHRSDVWYRSSAQYCSARTLAYEINVLGMRTLHAFASVRLLCVLAAGSLWTST